MKIREEGSQVVHAKYVRLAGFSLAFLTMTSALVSSNGEQNGLMPGLHGDQWVFRNLQTETIRTIKPFGEANTLNWPY